MTPAAAVETAVTVARHDERLKEHDAAIADVRGEMREGFKTINGKLWVGLVAALGAALTGAGTLLMLVLGKHP